MSQSLDVESFLRNGYWQNTRARSPDPNVINPPSPIQSASYVDPTAPRRLPFNVGRPRRPPPPPSVEDEIESLAKEFGSLVSTVSNEEPPNRGDVEQCPILLPAHNTERRFVIVPNSSDSSSDGSTGTEKQPQRRTKSKEPRIETYEANTGRKYDVHASSDGVNAKESSSDKKHDARPSRDRRRSKLDDLPAIVTDTSPDLRSRESKKAKSASGLEQTGSDYFSPREGSRRQGESLLSPDVIKHSTRGKDRAYWDGGRTSPNSQSRSRPSYSNEQRGSYDRRDGRYKESGHKSTHSASPTFEKRQSTIDLSAQTRRTPKESYERTRRDTEIHPARLDRKDSSRSYARSERESISQRPSNYRDQRDSPPYDSSEDDTRRRYEDSRRRRKSFVRDDRRDYLDAPAELRSKSRRRSQLPSPDPTVRGSQGSLYEYSSSAPRSSTFPKESKSSSDEDRPERPLSRASTARSAFSSAAAVVVPAVIAAVTAAATESSTPTHPLKSTLPPLPKTELRSECSSASAISSGSSRQNWQPPKFEPPTPPPHQDGIYSNSNGGGNSDLTSSYRRYSDVAARWGELDDIPECPRTRAEAGHVDWLTFPRCDNFNVCPSCYGQAFAPYPQFAHAFVPAPFRPSNRPLACDFGRSPWYQLAWLQTLKYERANLSLFHGIAGVLARTQTQQPCPGSFRESYRLWYSIRDPRSSSSGTGGGGARQPFVRGFTVCNPCARLVETVLPNLTGVFVPVGAEPSLGVCALHCGSSSSSSDSEDEDGGPRERFMAYLSALETVSDQALAARAAPDMQDLADRIAGISAKPECRRGAPVRDAWWYVMRSIPDLTVCEACFDEVVAPALQQQQQDDRIGNGNNNGAPSVAGDFHYRPQRLPLAACQLYSDRMRDVFAKAMRRRDLGYLESRVRERRAREQEYYAKVTALDRQQSSFGPEWTAREAERLLSEWRKWE